MSYKTVQGYVLAIITGAVLLAAVILIVLQWDQRAGFLLYGADYGIHLDEGRVTGGINTALLVIFSAVGGVILWWCVKILFRSVRSISRGRREDQAKGVSRRVEKLEKAGGEKSS